MGDETEGAVDKTEGVEKVNKSSGQGENSGLHS